MEAARGGDDGCRRPTHGPFEFISPPKNTTALVRSRRPPVERKWVGIVFCNVIVLAGFLVYFTQSLEKVKRQNEEVMTAVRARCLMSGNLAHQQQVDGDDDGDLLLKLKRSTNADKKRRTKKKKKRRKCTSCKKNKRFTVTASHFETNMWKDITIEQFKGGSCFYSDIWDGKVCRNRTFTNKKSTQVIKALFRNSPNNEFRKQALIKAPVHTNINGSVTISKSGLFLIYSHIVSYSKKSQSYAIFVNNSPMFPCLDGVNWNSVIKSGIFHSRRRSCTITVVQYLNKADSIDVRNIERGSTIDISEHYSYFGLVMLAK